jgi:UDP-N-acetylmuramoyl-L-alanyl-D-glutamate--2,6-diaminopimelate ligase
MKAILQLTKKILGTKLTRTIRPLYGNSGEKLTLIGINGTKGKTTTTVIAGRLANLAGIKSGYISTAIISVGDGKGEFLNPYKMTSIDSFAMHKYLKQMVQNGCTHAVIEMSSQGLEQNRHWGLGGFNEVVFLNIFPEHIEAHGSFENYKKAKSVLYKHVRNHGVFIGNGDFVETEYMWQMVPNDRKDFTRKVIVNPSNYSSKPSKKLYKDICIAGTNYATQFTADFDIQNCYFALCAIAHIQSVTQQQAAKLIPKLAPLLKNIPGIPGRMEWVYKSRACDILVDYAHEPESMRLLLETLYRWKEDGEYNHIIHVISCDGAGRDDWKKPVMGDLSKKYANIVIATTDNYDTGDDPEQIVSLLTQNYPESEKGSTYYTIPIRKKAFKKALELCKSLKGKTLIVSTGVGSEQGLTQPGGHLKWDERVVWKKLLKQ